MNKKIKCLIFGLVLFLVSLFGPRSVFADETFGSQFVFGPTSQRISLIPGESYRASVYISSPNDSVGDIDLMLYVDPYDVINDQYDPSFDKESTYTQIVDWIVLDQNEVTISPNEKIDIGFTINVPEDAPAGGQYAAIIAQKVVGGEQGDGVNITDIAAIGSVLVAEVAGETREEGVISENNMPSFLLSSPLEATSLARNNGNVHTDVEYILQVWPLFSDEEICTNEENVSTSLILPETERYHTESCNLPSVGIFRAKQTVKIFGETSTVEKTVIVCPLWLLFLIIFGIAAIIIYFVTRAKARKKNAE